MNGRVVIQLASPIPVMTCEEFARHVGMSESWVNNKIANGEIPIMPKKGREKPLINVAKYWLQALEQPY
ncbi:hypothetical protein P9Z72_07605 [Glaesserella parasuis]|uniref:hypothetical protein n=1 Tax=Glaesserella parasuis TaxID=738 RepID=UPI002436C210|nr:hypothetical protein [Glaesserella parasuis]MDG6312386.1 hypothetical protein [Glaesserella parasuis]